MPCNILDRRRATCVLDADDPGSLAKHGPGGVQARQNVPQPLVQPLAVDLGQALPGAAPDVLVLAPVLDGQRRQSRDGAGSLLKGVAAPVIGAGNAKVRPMAIFLGKIGNFSDDQVRRLSRRFIDLVHERRYRG